MLLTKKLIENVEEKYVDMLKAVNIPDFTKCIAEFSGLEINKINDETIKDYLVTWAKNKYRFYQMLGNKLQLDKPFTYKKFRDNITSEMSELGIEFPVYSLWLDAFKRQLSNKINTYSIGYEARDKIRMLFPQYKMEGSLITHFFKKMLNAPDELVTKIASIFENDTVEATHTISIDPVDMMLASENPYNWESCYRLETENTSSHADGCMAAVLDTSSLITYVWNNEGKLNIYDRYDFKCVRYKRMRQWIALSEKMTTIHFNSIYPGKSYDSAFEKSMRLQVESVIADYLKIKDSWKQAQEVDTDRLYHYGYGEFKSYNMYVQNDAQEESITVYNEPYTCACGCGEEIEPSSCDRELKGIGFQHNCYEDRYYCEYIDDYCSCECCEENCYDCDTWIENHPVCSLDGEECENPDWDEIRHGTMEAQEHHCCNCPRWAACYGDDDDEIEVDDLD